MKVGALKKMLEGADEELSVVIDLKHDGLRLELGISGVWERGSDGTARTFVLVTGNRV